MPYWLLKSSTEDSPGARNAKGDGGESVDVLAHKRYLRNALSGDYRIGSGIREIDCSQNRGNGHGCINFSLFELRTE
jgi:hypothetical protein